MKRAVALVATVVILAMDFWYCSLILRGETQPALATWILFCAAVTISFATYWATPGHSLVNNIGNTADLIGVWLVLTVVLVAGREVKTGFNRFEIGCLAVSAVVLVFWRLTDRHVTANLLIQGVMVVAYFPTIYRLSHATTSTEPLLFWFATWLSAVMILVPAVMARDRLAMVYGFRAFALVSLVVALIVRLSV